MLLFEGAFNPETGQLDPVENIKIEKIDQNINDKLFVEYEKSWANNIRKAYDAIPAVLIDYEESKLGTTSGEAIRQAADYYNQQTAIKRAFISDSFKDMFRNYKDARLRDANFEILPLKFGSNGTLDVQRATND